jgi:hypothetical protein
MKPDSGKYGRRLERSTQFASSNTLPQTKSILLGTILNYGTLARGSMIGA